MKSATYFPYHLVFKQPSGTSRGVLHTKETFILEISENNQKGAGECAVFRGLSSDDVPEYETKLKWLCDNINLDENIIKKQLINFPSIWFGYEQAMRNLKFGSDIYFPSEFSNGNSSITINGLIWMGDANFMKHQINEKLTQGFTCIKLKIGVDWKSEKEILKNLRNNFPASQLELRVDANGGFSFSEAKTVLKELADLDIHSIEQPIKKSDNPFSMEFNWMAELCAETPIPIALDEELIGHSTTDQKQKLLEIIQPQFIILKPALVGGFSGTDEWISLAEKTGIGWWITSALESNIGLTAIAQYTYTKNPSIPQGLGTGALFTNNFPTHLHLEGDQLSMKKV